MLLNGTVQVRCIYQCKDTNFKANHNNTKWRQRKGGVVFTNAKILILKLITTLDQEPFQSSRLYLPMQRY